MSVYYALISDAEHRKSLSGLTSLNDKEISIISQVFHFRRNKVQLKFGTSDYEMGPYNPNKELYIILHKKNLYINIYKLDDEWYLVGGNAFFDSSYKYQKYQYYKCDQLDGLIKCLEDIL